MTASRRYAWVLVLLVGVGLFEAVRRAVVDTGNPNLLPSLILLGAAVIPAAFVAFITGRGLPIDVSGATLALVALIGGVVGVVAAGTWEFNAMRQLGAVPMVVVGLSEEAAKLVVPVLLLATGRWRRLANGLVIGVASGAGFAALETMGYAFVTLIATRGDLGAVDGVLVLRGLLSPAAHMAWTGLTAAALWQAGARGWSATALVRFLGVFVLAVVLHATWDSIGTLTGYLVLAVISLGLLVHTTHRLSAPDRVAQLTSRLPVR